ncbi:MFS transporter [Streptococcus dysgalactiae]|uniref:MFS transporter n=1 Tax=Streptococcus dysgalactiae TaxID=1334 RepID=UPI000826FF23|nr:MFS transporter [Streptococcus dysgalactiae]OCX04612.1 FMN adenylyltransferase [Streptococcus dysgalactiae subsp. equisimilis]VTT07041.1 transporter [Streptococcus dysgalactiae subsp. equisimilis]
MTKNEYRLLTSRAVNKIGNVIYDYGNSSWIAGLGVVGQKYLGYYQLVDSLIALFLNPIGGAIADRYKRRQILLWTDAIGAIACGLLTFMPSKQGMLFGLITVNAILAISHAFSGTSFRAYVVTLVKEERLVDFNAHLEIISQIISISSPLLAFWVVDRLGLRPALLLDSISFALSFVCLWSITTKETHLQPKSGQIDIRHLLTDIKEGLDFIHREKEIFFLLTIATLVNFFIAAFNYLLPFSNQLFNRSSSYATMLSLGAVGAILGALFANKYFKNNYQSLLIALGISGLGLAMLTPLHLAKVSTLVLASGNLWFKCFLTIFNIHFFSMVQKKVPKALLGRVFSSIFTLAVLLMPLATILMTALPMSVNPLSFSLIGFGISLTSLLAYIYARQHFM